MKIGRYEAKDGERIAVIVGGASDEARVLDVVLAAAARGIALTETRLKNVIAAGQPALDVLQKVADWAQTDGEQSWFSKVDEVRWKVPAEPRTFIGTGRNFGRHRDESMRFWSKQGVSLQDDFPTGFLQLPHLMVPHGADVERPPYVEELDYEVEVAAVIGSPPPQGAGEKEAQDSIFGYTIFNDLSAREWQRREMQNQLVLVGKNFPGSAPVGPWILTADEAGDPERFVMELKVNGETRQRETCADMIFSFGQLVAFWSRVGFASGDIVTSGTPKRGGYASEAGSVPLLSQAGRLGPRIG